MTWFPPAEGRFTSDFGPRVAPTTGASTFHRGVDIAPPIPGQTGRPVVAVHGGTVVSSNYSSVRGWWVVIQHDDGSYTRSQHLAERGVPWGARVEAGERIGTIGATGRSVGPHLHFETFKPGSDWTSSYNAVDPEPFMRARGVELREAVLVTNPLWDIGGLPIVPVIPPLPEPIDPIGPSQPSASEEDEVNPRDAIIALFLRRWGQTPDAASLAEWIEYWALEPDKTKFYRTLNAALQADVRFAKFAALGSNSARNERINRVAAEAGWA